MKKIIIFLLCLGLFGCEPKQIEVIHTKMGYTSEFIGVIPFAFSRYEEIDCGKEKLCLMDDTSDDLKYYEIHLNDKNVIQKEWNGSNGFVDEDEEELFLKYQNDTFAIYRKGEEIKNEEGEIIDLLITYYYADRDETKMLYQHSIDNLSYVPYVSIYYDKNVNKDIFFYNNENEVILNEIVDGKLNEIQRYSLEDEYEFYGVDTSNQEFALIVANEEYKKYILDKEVYEVGIDDQVVITDEYIYHSVMGSPLKGLVLSELIDRSTQRTIELSEVIDFTGFVEFDDNQYLFVDNFMENDTYEKYYTLFMLNENEIEIIQLPFEYYAYNYFYIVDENQIVFTMYEKQDELSLYLITLEE